MIHLHSTAGTEVGQYCTKCIESDHSLNDRFLFFLKKKVDVLNMATDLFFRGRAEESSQTAVCLQHESSVRQSGRQHPVLQETAYNPPTH